MMLADDASCGPALKITGYCWIKFQAGQGMRLTTACVTVDGDNTGRNHWQQLEASTSPPSHITRHM
jgi:hypothetical protein